MGGKGESREAVDRWSAKMASLDLQKSRSSGFRLEAGRGQTGRSEDLMFQVLTFEDLLDCGASVELQCDLNTLEDADLEAFGGKAFSGYDLDDLLILNDFTLICSELLKIACYTSGAPCTQGTFYGLYLVGGHKPPNPC
ncbi:hypothetical protein KSP39_PZI011475 [Platanthera zijinensis]|uniref:Uncharacterized protein n=1 Tax=Platanthera zijinensis TaxID=2320716 RepID=A0AAP0BGU3_9ASPA